MAVTVAPFLMFEGAAGEALELYASAFDDAEVLDVQTFGEDGPGKAGTIEAAFLRIGDQRIRLFDSPVEHAFGFTPAVSLFVEFDTSEDVDADGARRLPVQPPLRLVQRPLRRVLATEREVRSLRTRRVGVTGLEPVTSSLSSWRSPN
jgi:3-demethylubiquinone-9 3-methyltransferase